MHPAASEHDEIRIAEILREKSFQVRHKMDRSTVLTYASAMRAGDEFPPVRIARIDGALVLVDGWHRVAAVEFLGRDSISAVIFDATEKQAKLEGAKANLTHGLPLKRREHREVFRAYVRAGQHRRGAGFKSYREIGKDLHGIRGHTTIRHWMRKDFPSVFRQMGSGEGALDGPGDPEATDGFFETATQALADAANAARAVKDPKHLWQLKERTRVLLEQLQERAPATRPYRNLDF